MHKPAQVELQLNRPQLPYSEILGSIIAGGSPAHYRRRKPKPNTPYTKKGPYRLISCLPKSSKGMKDDHLTFQLHVFLTPPSLTFQFQTLGFCYKPKFKILLKIYNKKMSSSSYFLKAIKTTRRVYNFIAILLLL